ncbi:MAG: VOC family protein [Kiritimatiellaeota bacterium]|nr:VOC family protein [Kiritimatiellota bacterium]
MNRHITRLSHVGIQTTDLGRSLAWYTHVLGLDEAFRLVRDGKTWIVYLHAAGQSFIELFAPRPGMDAPPHAHFSLQVADIEAAVTDLRKRLPPESSRHDEIMTGTDGSRLYNFFDPDGHRIEFQELRPESRQARALA